MFSRDPRTWMWAEACELLEQAERLHKQFFQPGARRGATPTWEPPIDIFETDTELRICVALPGVGVEGVKIQLEKSVVIVMARRVIPAETRAGVIRRLEIPYGHFVRRIALPDGSYEIQRQEMVNGCVELSLRRL